MGKVLNLAKYLKSQDNLIKKIEDLVCEYLIQNPQPNLGISLFKEIRRGVTGFKWQNLSVELDELSITFNKLSHLYAEAVFYHEDGEILFLIDIQTEQIIGYKIIVL